MNHRNRKQYIHELLTLVQEERQDLSISYRKLTEYTEQYDKKWHMFCSIYQYIMLYSSIIAIISIKSPNFFIRLTKRGVGLWNIWKLFKSIKSPNFFIRLTKRGVGLWNIWKLFKSILR